MKPFVRVSFWTGAAASLTLILFATHFARHARSPDAAAKANNISRSNSAAQISGTPLIHAPRPVHAFPGFERRPFAVSLSREGCEWTAEDGRDTNVIHLLAHNELEYARMLDENSRIFRRQLVYRKETAAALIERAKFVGETIRELTLPTLDGQEVQFEITRADLAPSGLQGTFTGRVAGKADSMVTFAFKVNREAFTILSPSDRLYIQADPREPGEVILKEINPALYAAGACGNP